MREIELSTLYSGVYYTKPLYLDKNFILLSPELPISEKMLRQLKESGYKKVYTKGEKSNNPTYSKNKTKKQQVKNYYNEDETRKESIKYYVSTVKFFCKVFSIFAQSDTLDRNLLTDKIKQMQMMLEHDKETFLHLPDINAKNYLIVDAVKSTFLALALGDILKLPQYRQLELGLSAALHDIGMFKIPSELYLNDNKLNPEDLDKIRNHVTIGALAAKQAGFSKEVVQAIQEHQENCDGSGYPYHLKKDEISLYGRILGVIGAYIAATSKRLFREKKGNHFGLIEILQQTSNLYDPQIAKILILMLTIYPTGTYVKLVDGSKGIVIKASMQDPKHPIVKLLIDVKGQPIEEYVTAYTLKDEQNIKRALVNEEIQELKKILEEHNIQND